MESEKEEQPRLLDRLRAWLYNNVQYRAEIQSRASRKPGEL